MTQDFQSWTPVRGHPWVVHPKVMRPGPAAPPRASGSDGSDGWCEGFATLPDGMAVGLQVKPFKANVPTSCFKVWKSDQAPSSLRRRCRTRLFCRVPRILDTPCVVYHTEVAMRQRRAIAVAVLAVLLFAPVVMAFDNCPTMGAMCEAPCGVSSCAIHALPAPVTLSPVVGRGPAPRTDDLLLERSLTLLEPPPKSFLLPA